MAFDRKGYYIRRQTNAGPNQGKWRVYDPQGLSVALGESKQQALMIAAAFTVAMYDPARGSQIGCSNPAAIGFEERYGGRVYPDWRRGPDNETGKGEG